MSELIGRVLEHWCRNDAAPSTPCTVEQIRKFERRERVTAPDDLRRFFLAANGMNLGFRLGKDAEGFAFWHLDDLVRADAELERRSPSSARPENSEDLYAFADYMDWSWAYAIRLRGNGLGSVVLIGGDGVVPCVAKSFTEFLERYLSDSMSLFPRR